MLAKIIESIKENARAYAATIAAFVALIVSLGILEPETADKLQTFLLQLLIALVGAGGVGAAVVMSKDKPKPPPHDPSTNNPMDLPKEGNGQ